MTKIVCLVLLFAVVICSVFGWSCNEFNAELSVISDELIKLSVYAEDIISQLRNVIDESEFNPSDEVIDTGNTSGDHIFVSDHTECYVYYVSESGGNSGNIINSSNISYRLYSIEIKTKGEYHFCYCIGFKDNALVSRIDYQYVVIYDNSDSNSLVGWRFYKMGIWMSTVGGFTTRSYKNLTFTNKTLADIDHECQIQNGGN